MLFAALTPQAASAAAGSPFQPPSGWRHVGTQTGGLGTWLHEGDTGYTQNVSAQAAVFNGNLADLSARNQPTSKGRSTT